MCWLTRRFSWHTRCLRWSSSDPLGGYLYPPVQAGPVTHDESGVPVRQVRSECLPARHWRDEQSTDPGILSRLPVLSDVMLKSVEIVMRGIEGGLAQGTDVGHTGFLIRSGRQAFRQTHVGARRGGADRAGGGRGTRRLSERPPPRSSTSRYRH